MTGKEKCRLLRDIRRKIAQDNDIPFPQEECRYAGDDCTGTCPMCDEELLYLEQKLRQKRRESKHLNIYRYDAEFLRFQSNDEATQEEEDALVLDSVLPALPEDLDWDMLMLKLNRVGIITIGDLRRFSPEALAQKGNLTEKELDMLSQRLPLRESAWERRYRRSRTAGVRGVIKRPMWMDL